MAIFFSMSILWKTFPTSFNNERTWKEFLSSSSRLRRKSKIKRRRTRRIKFWRTFASFSLTATKFNTRSRKYPPVHSIWADFLTFFDSLFLGGWPVSNFWTDNLKSKRFDGIKFWKFDKFFEWIEFLLENDFTGTSIVTIESCREKNNRCIWFFSQSSHCKLEVHSKCSKKCTKKFCAHDKNALQSVILHWPYYCNMWQICDTRDNLANLAHHLSF